MAKKRARPNNGIQINISDRKARRQEQRKLKKKKPRLNDNDFDDWAKFREKEIQKDHVNKEEKSNHSVDKKLQSAKKRKARSHTSTKLKAKESLKTKKENIVDIYDMVDDQTAAEMRKDDEEIARLEEKLGLHNGEADKKKLNKEYAKLEGYGDDFGDFLDGLDDMLVNIAGGEGYDEDIADMEYDSDESDQAVARAKYLIRQEQLGHEGRKGSKTGEIDSSDSEGEEMIPMKGPAVDDSIDDDDSESLKESSDSDQYNSEELKGEGSEPSDGSDSKGDHKKEGSEEKSEPDHDEEDVYRPIGGQDLYGNVIGSDQNQSQKPTKYIPPHLRKLQTSEAATKSIQIRNNDDDVERQQELRVIQKLLNNNLNRLSENTLESVAKSITSIYKSSTYSSRDINEKYWKNMRTACVPSHMIMASLVPIYIACAAGVHYQAGDLAHLGGFVIENAVLDLWDEMKRRKDNKIKLSSSISNDVDTNDPLGSGKETVNLMLIICYLYNYNVVHCSLIYDIIRRFIENFTEIDVELLLLILSHCGSQLRSDDPGALKDIVNLVQDRSMEIMTMNKVNQNKEEHITASRAQFMISAIIDLKNNKRREADIVLAEKTSHYRRVIGRMKSALSPGTGRADSLRLSVQDIFDIEKKGRWWVVGGTWIGNQHRNVDLGDQSIKTSETMVSKSDEPQSTIVSDLKQMKLLKLAAKQRMNTDLRRSIFCIIMGSDDCQDALEKLVRSALLKGRSEREVVRVLVHCCSQEKVYNPYYAHLANRICDYQNKSKFTFQLCLWDSFKQFESMKPRKAANLAKLMAHLVMNFKLNLNVLRTIDISPQEMPESAIIFLTILFSNIFEAYDDATCIVDIFQRGDPSKEQLMKQATEAIDNDDAFISNERQTLKDNISIFLMHYLEKSPKAKNSQFRKNLKAAVKACEEDNLDYMM